ncbi:MAG TPA: YkvA family protein [Anaerolineaceae bacterium]|nr:YkvA family protein [Anaerolineaceae bacterium]
MAGFVEQWKARAQKLKKEVYALYLSYRDPRVPWYAKAFTAVVVAYAFSPIDLIPDFVPVLGYLDDLLLIPLGVTIALKLIPAEVISEHRNSAEEIMRQGGPGTWWIAAIIIAIWVTIGAVALFWLFQWLAN